MKYDLTQTLKAFDGRDITDVTSGAEVAATVRLTLERACINCDPRAHASGDEKYKIYKLLQKIHAAEVEVELTVEEVSLLKTIVGEVYPVAVVGPIYEVLEQK